MHITATTSAIVSALLLLTMLMVFLDQVAVRWFLPFDREVSRTVARHRTGDETLIMRAASVLGGPCAIVTVTAIGVLGLISAGRIAAAAAFFVVMLASVGYALAVKLLTARKRPSHGLERQRTYSFPSAHTLASTVMYMTLALLVPGGPLVLGFFTLLILTIGASRVYLGVHYLSDVLAGYLAGAVWIWIFFLIIPVP